MRSAREMLGSAGLLLVVLVLIAHADAACGRCWISDGLLSSGLRVKSQDLGQEVFDWAYGLSFVWVAGVKR